MLRRKEPFTLEHIYSKGRAKARNWVITIAKGYHGMTCHEGRREVVDKKVLKK